MEYVAAPCGLEIYLSNGWTAMGVSSMEKLWIAPSFEGHASCTTSNYRISYSVRI